MPSASASVSAHAPPPADFEVARRLLSATAFVAPEMAVLGPLVPWAAHEARLSVHVSAEDVETIPFRLVPPHLASAVDRLFRSSWAAWRRSDPLPEEILAEANRHLELWRRRRMVPVKSASVLVRTEHGYRFRFHTNEHDLDVDVAASPPRIIREVQIPIERPVARWAHVRRLFAKNRDGDTR